MKPFRLFTVFYCFPPLCCVFVLLGQNPEVAAHHVLQVHAAVPWEFTANATATGPVRSVFPLLLTSALPLAAVHALTAPNRPSHALLLAAPRLWVFVLSLLHDVGVRRLASAHGVAPRAACTLLAVSWPAMALFTRPLSNTLEAFLVTAVMWLSTAAVPATRREKATALGARLRPPLPLTPSAVAVGALVAAGTFTRFTFPLFVAPALLPLAAFIVQSARWGAIAAAAFAAAVTAVALAAGDAWFFGVALRRGWIPTLWTPFNAAMYNADAAQLATHGVHPWWHHFAVNMPFMWAACLAFAVLGFSCVGRQPMRSGVLLGAVAVPIVALSAVCHKEARFLLPLGAPLAVLGAPGFAAARRWLVATWAILNVVVAAFMGAAHQAGVVPAIATVAAVSDNPALCGWSRVGAGAPGAPTAPTVAVFVQTYPPPLHLAAWPLSAPAPLAVIPAASVAAAVAATAPGGASAPAVVVVVAPGALRDEVRTAAHEQGWHHTLPVVIWPHFSGELHNPSLTMDVHCWKVGA